MLKITKMTKLVNMEKMLKMGNMTNGGRPENCRDLVFPVSFPTGRLQHGELLQQVGKST